MQFAVRPEIREYSTCREFAEAFNIGEGDLIVTNRYIYEPFFGEMKLSCEVIFQEEFGEGEPSDEMAQAIFRTIQKRPERIIGIGGGTVLDLSKLFALKQVLPVHDLFDGKLPLKKDKQLILVPATCGTGSEVTNISILALKSRNTKKGLASPELFADYAVLIPELPETLPFHFFATSSIDALIHAAESALSPKATEYSRLFSYKAMKMIIEGYKQIRANGADARFPLLKDFLIASDFAGIAFGNAGCAAVHALSYPLGAAFHVAHGEANYALFTAVLKYYNEHRPEGELTRLKEFLAKELDCGPEESFDELESLLGCLLLRKSLREYGMIREQLESFTGSVLENQQRLLANNFVPFNAEDILTIYSRLF